MAEQPDFARCCQETSPIGADCLTKWGLKEQSTSWGLAVAELSDDASLVVDAGDVAGCRRPVRGERTECVGAERKLSERRGWGRSASQLEFQSNSHGLDVLVKQVT